MASIRDSSDGLGLRIQGFGRVVDRLVDDRIGEGEAAAAEGADRERQAELGERQQPDGDDRPEEAAQHGGAAYRASRRSPLCLARSLLPSAKQANLEASSGPLGTSHHLRPSAAAPRPGPREESRNGVSP